MPRRPAISLKQILDWADEFRARRDCWPTRTDGIVVGGGGMTWYAVDQALRKGNRGLVGGQSLAQVLLTFRKKRHRNRLPPFTRARVLAWADAHHQRTGEWPTDRSGPIPEAPGETWNAVHKALVKGRRGFPSGSSLARFLDAHRGVRNPRTAPAFTVPSILTWADDHHAHTGRWPTRSSGGVRAAAPETWAAVDAALIAGGRGLPGGESLAQLLARCRGVRHIRNLPALTEEQIRSWARAHQRRTGRWPTVKSGPVLNAPGETWAAINASLRVGRRGLPGGSSLDRLLGPLRETEHSPGVSAQGARPGPGTTRAKRPAVGSKVPN